jgi:hypothetical protein
MLALPGRRYPDRIDDDAKPPEDSFVPPEGTLLDAPYSARADDQFSVIVCARSVRRSRPVRFTGQTRTSSSVARFGPTTPTRAGRLADASSITPTRARAWRTNP